LQDTRKTKAQLIEELNSARRRIEQLEKSASASRESLEALWESENKYSKLFENAMDAIFLLEAEGEFAGQILSANQAAAEMHGYGINEIVGKNIREIAAEDEVKSVKERLHRFLDGKWIKDEHLHRKKDGSVFPVEMHAGLIEYENRRYIIAIDRDISKRRQAEEALRESEERQRIIIENTYDVISIIEKKGRWRFLNPSIERISGYEIKELSVAQIEQLFHPDDFPRAMNFIDRILENPNAPLSDEFRMLHKNGSWVVLEAIGVNLHDNPAIKGILINARDITMRKRIEADKEIIQKQLMQAQKMEALGTLAGGIAHDFNNILGIILGFTQLALKKFSQDAVLRNNLEQVVRAGGQAKDLVKQILTFSRQTEEEPEPVHVSPIVKETLKMLRSTLPSTIKIRQDIKAESAIVLADPVQIHQVLMNLCTNAAHAMRNDLGSMEVCLYDLEICNENVKKYKELETGRYLTLTVSDTGHGIQTEIIERIFDPYFTTKDPGEGTGLGLAVVHGIVRKLGGMIKVKSELEKGSEFTIMLPQIETIDTLSCEDHSDLPTGNEIILFVDDDRTMVFMMQQILEELGYSVIARTSSLKALEVFKEKCDEIDLVISDQTMPDMTGINLAREILSIRPELPVILCTGYSEEVNSETIKAAGISDLMMKPLDICALANTIRKVLE